MRTSELMALLNANVEAMNLEEVLTVRDLQRLIDVFEDTLLTALADIRATQQPKEWNENV